MRKEVVFAIIAGSLLGLVIAFGIWRANLALKAMPVEQKETNQNSNNTNTISQFGLTIASPENQSISTSSSIEISGITRPNTFVVATTEKKDHISKSDEKGAFKVEVDLSGGINLIKLTSLDPKNGSAEQRISLIYSSEFKKFVETNEEDANESTDEAETIREKIKEKIKDAENKPLAYIGTVTDITDKTIQIKDESGEILQISLDSEETEYVKSTTETKKIEHKDLAIGDYIAALGFKNTNNVLEGKRIIVTTKPAEVKLTTIFGEITKVAKSELTIKDNEEFEWKTQFGKKWDGPNLSKSEVGQKVIVVGEQEEATLSSTRTLYLVEESE